MWQNRGPSLESSCFLPLETYRDFRRNTRENEGGNKAKCKNMQGTGGRSDRSARRNEMETENEMQGVKGE